MAKSLTYLDIVLADVYNITAPKTKDSKTNMYVNGADGNLQYKFQWCTAEHPFRTPWKVGTYQDKPGAVAGRMKLRCVVTDPDQLLCAMIEKFEQETLIPHLENYEPFVRPSGVRPLDAAATKAQITQMFTSLIHHHIDHGTYLTMYVDTLGDDQCEFSELDGGIMKPISYLDMKPFDNFIAIASLSTVYNGNGKVGLTVCCNEVLRLPKPKQVSGGFNLGPTASVPRYANVNGKQDDLDEESKRAEARGSAPVVVGEEKKEPEKVEAPKMRVDPVTMEIVPMDPPSAVKEVETVKMVETVTKTSTKRKLESESEDEEDTPPPKKAKKSEKKSKKKKKRSKTPEPSSSEEESSDDDE